MLLSIAVNRPTGEARMTIRTATAFVFLLALTGCNKDDEAVRRDADESVRVTTESAKPGENDLAAADNANLNDRGLDTPPQGEQRAEEVDLAITQMVRQSVMKEDKLSARAKNAEIVTRDGVVTLRGPVQRPEESTLLMQIARTTDGVRRIDNQLEIESP
jgi:osmotically-inducible protein OsmY